MGLDIPEFDGLTAAGRRDEPPSVRGESKTERRIEVAMDGCKQFAFLRIKPTNQSGSGGSGDERTVRRRCHGERLSPAGNHPRRAIGLSQITEPELMVDALRDRHDQNPTVCSKGGITDYAVN